MAEVKEEAGRLRPLTATCFSACPVPFTRVRELSDCFDQALPHRGRTLGGFRLRPRRILARLRRRYNEGRLHSASGYLPPREFYREDPNQRFEHRRGKLFQVRHRRRERNLEFRRGTLPLESEEAVPSS
jgi:hypothetical protein